MEMKLNVKDAKKAGEKGLEQGMKMMRPMQLLHGWGVRSEHAYSAGIGALGIAIACRVFSGRSHDEGHGWAHLFGKAAPFLMLVGLGLKHEE